MTELTKTQKIQELVDEWIEGADTESIFEYAAQKLTEWYEDKEDKVIDNFYQEMLAHDQADTFHNDMFEVEK